MVLMSVDDLNNDPPALRLPGSFLIAGGVVLTLAVIIWAALFSRWMNSSWPVSPSHEQPAETFRRH
jgi:hypothetical protein